LIGGGSNMLLVNDIDKLVVHLNTKGKEIIKKDETYTWVQVAAGENWHEFVLWCIENDLGGVENLALIPGNVGTAPIQNIGAYGVEVKDVIESLKVLEIATGIQSKFTANECNFGYRNSIFKNISKDKYVITHVTFRLTHSNHKINDSYGAIKSIVKYTKDSNLSIKAIADAVIAIRKVKLPDPKEIGNSGSFFKNPIISKLNFNRIQKDYPDIPNYPVPSNTKLVKLAAGWLIDQCGFKGKRYGDAGVHNNQALVLVNYGNATGKDILAVAKKIQKEVKEKFNVVLEMEVNIIS
jgi:UDP-N-acetylmuramate dehydrogenase